MSSVVSSALHYFSTISIKGKDLPGGGGEFLNIKWVFLFSLQHLSETFLILRINERYIINLFWSSYEFPVIHVSF